MSTLERLPFVEETVLKRRKRRLREAEHSERGRVAVRGQRQRGRSGTFTRAEKLIKGQQLKRRDAIRLQRSVKKKTFLSDEPFLAFVIRITDAKQPHERVAAVLELLRLRRLNQGVFLRVTPEARRLLEVCEPCVAWGRPDLRSVRDLLQRRGHTRNDAGRRIPLDSNELVEERLGHCGVVCLEDIVDEIFTLGENFSEVNNFLETFTLKKPTGGWRHKARPFSKGGSFGYRGEEINALLRLMV